MSGAADKLRASALSARAATARPIPSATPATRSTEPPVPQATATPELAPRETRASPAAKPPPAHRTPVRQTDIKKTVALAPAINRKLGDWQNRAADDLGLARVTAQEVMAALVDELLADPQLAQTIKARLSQRNS